jgi:hypothetical protein
MILGIDAPMNRAEWILYPFTVLRNYEETDHGEFRTKCHLLEIYDAMEEAKGGVIGRIWSRGIRRVAMPLMEVPCLPLYLC